MNSLSQGARLRLLIVLALVGCKLSPADQGSESKAADRAPISSVDDRADVATRPDNQPEAALPERSEVVSPAGGSRNPTYDPEACAYWQYGLCETDFHDASFQANCIQKVPDAKCRTLPGWLGWYMQCECPSRFGE